MAGAVQKTYIPSEGDTKTARRRTCIVPYDDAVSRPRYFEMGGQIDERCTASGLSADGRQINKRRSERLVGAFRVGMQAHLLIPEGTASVVPPCVGTDAQGVVNGRVGEGQMLLRRLCSARSILQRGHRSGSIERKVNT